MPRDPAQRAKAVVDMLTGQAPPEPPPKPPPKPKNRNAVALGRRGGKVGGKVRASRMTAEERSEAARKAVAARWAKAKAETSEHGA